MPASMQLDVLGGATWVRRRRLATAALYGGRVARTARRRCLLFVTPEYNFRSPAASSRDRSLSRGEDQPLSGKPVAMVTATTGRRRRSGAIRPQSDAVRQRDR
jgi:hypothetical protein